MKQSMGKVETQSWFKKKEGKQCHNELYSR